VNRRQKDDGRKHLKCDDSRLDSGGITAGQLGEAAAEERQAIQVRRIFLVLDPWYGPREGHGFGLKVKQYSILNVELHHVRLKESPTP
jgi:hypothetical protein